LTEDSLKSGKRFVFGRLAEQDKETAMALIKTVTTKLDQEVKADDGDADGI